MLKVLSSVSHSVRITGMELEVRSQTSVVFAEAT